MRALERKLIRDLLHLRGQVLAVALVLASGIALFVGMLSVYDSLEITRDEYYERSRLADVFASIQRAPSSVADRLRRIQGVELVEERIVKEVAVEIAGLEEPATGRLVSIPSDPSSMLNRLSLQSGRWIDPTRQTEVIASATFAAANGLRLGDSIGAVIGDRWRVLSIVGMALSAEYIYEMPPGGALFADNKHFGVLWMGRDAMRSAFAMSGAFNDVVIGIERGVDPQFIVDRVDRILAPYGCVESYEREDQLSCTLLRGDLEMLRTTGLYMPVLFILIAAFLLNVVLSRLISLERDQIALLKAFGYSSLTVGLHYFWMCVAIVAIGAVIGIGVGIWFGLELTTVYTGFYHLPFLHYRLAPEYIAISVGLSLIAGSLGAWSAMLRVVALPPAEAMRPAKPARFRPGLVERIGLQRLLPSSARMVIRQFERSPWKSVISVLGVAVAVGELMLGRFAIDSMEFTRDTQFQSVQREDVVAVFASPRAPGSVRALATFPGVLRLEPFRLLPVRLHSGHRTRTIAIQGVDTGAELRRIIDENLVPFEPEEADLMMTEMLADKLGVSRGDMLEVEILEGRRRTRVVRVGELVREIVGLSAYMRRAALDRLAGSPAVSGAYLLVDDAERRELYRRLKRTPGVAGAQIREVTIEGYDRTVAEGENIRQVFVAGSALAIAIGIVYNSARIALSERGRELASLRVLGFTQREVSALLLGEQAILTLLGIPVGYAIGYAFDLLISFAYASERTRVPVVIDSSSYLYATVVVILAAVISGLLLRRRLRGLDLIEVLKTRE